MKPYADCLTLEEAGMSSLGYMLDQCIGCIDRGIDFGKLLVSAGDSLIFCTDGIYKSISEETLLNIFKSQCTLSAQVESLLQTARKASNKDDATVVVVHIGMQFESS